MSKARPKLKKIKRGVRNFFLAAAVCLLLVGLLTTGCSQAPATVEGDDESAASEQETQEQEGQEEQGEATVDEFIILATTTSTYDSGLLDFLLPVFTEKYGTEVRIVSQGTGQALETGKEETLMFFSSTTAEFALVEEGYFTDRQDVMAMTLLLSARLQTLPG